MKLSLKTSLDLEKGSLLQIIYLLCMFLCLFISHWGEGALYCTFVDFRKTFDNVYGELASEKKLLKVDGVSNFRSIDFVDFLKKTSL